MTKSDPVSYATLKKPVRYFRTEKGTGAEMRPAIFSGIVTGNVPFFLSLITVPEVFAKVNSAQIPSRF